MASDKKFNVTISAKDSASGTLAAINKRMSAINATIANARAPFEKLRSNYDRFLKLSGADVIAGGLSRVARAGFSAFQSVARIVEPLAAITGAASIAGMMRLATAWANFGTNLGNAANRAGLTVSQLHGLQNAARLAGVSAEALTSGMTTLRDNMVNAAGGKAPQVVSMLQVLGLSMDDARRYSQDTTKALPELADKIAGLKNPTLEAEAATALFGGAGEQLLPFLRKGAAGIAEYNALAAKYGVLNDRSAAAADKLREAQTHLTLAVEGLRNSVAEKLAPVLGPLLTQLADWIGKNREWMATGIGDAVKAFAGYMNNVHWAEIGDDIKSIYSAANNVAQALGGWKTVAEVVVGFFAVAWLAKMLLPIITVGSMLLGLPRKAAVAAAEANAELAKIKPGGGLGPLGKALIGGTIANDVLSTADPKDKMGSWIDRNVPGAAAVDNFASHFGFGRSYEEQKKADEALGPPGPQAPNASMAGKGAHPAEVNRRDPSLPSGRNTSTLGPRLANPSPEDATYKPLLDLIGRTEGTDRGRGYNETLGYGKFTGGPQNLTGMTLDQIDNLQQSMLDKQGNNPNRSSALGRYQFTQTTLRDMRKRFGLRGDQVFDEKTQDHLAALRIRMNGPATQDNVAKIWASLPDSATGRSHYGQRTGATSEEVQNALRAVTTPPAPSGPAISLPSNAGTAANPGGAGVVPNGQVQVGVNFGNAPPGTSTTAIQSGEGMAPLKVERSMVGGLDRAA